MTQTDQPPRHANTIAKIGDIDVTSAASHWNRVSPTPSDEFREEVNPLSVPSIMKIGDINTENAALHWRRGSPTDEI